MVSFLQTSSYIAATSCLLLLFVTSAAAELSNKAHNSNSNNHHLRHRGLNNDNNNNHAIQICESFGTTDNPYSNILKDPCLPEMNVEAPTKFSITFDTNYYGKFVATCIRDRAPTWVDRVYNLARYGYYNSNYFFRVVPNFVVQFGTAGNPSISNVYNYTSNKLGQCAILFPQPPDMQYCNKENSIYDDGDLYCNGNPNIGLSNTYGTLSMSTGYNEDLKDAYPNGVTWNATAELFINIGNNTRLDKNLFIPICTIDVDGMENSVTKFPSFGEIADLGGSGPDLGELYGQGNSYIESNTEWDTMAKTIKVDVCTIEA